VCARLCRTKFEPINPAPPVTRIAFEMSTLTLYNLRTGFSGESVGLSGRSAGREDQVPSILTGPYPQIIRARVLMGEPSLAYL